MTENFEHAGNVPIDSDVIDLVPLDDENGAAHVAKEDGTILATGSSTLLKRSRPQPSPSKGEE